MNGMARRRTLGFTRACLRDARGQADPRVLGCLLQLVATVIVAVVAIAADGTWRTEISFRVGDEARAGGGIPFEESYTARHWLLGLVRGDQPDGNLALAKYVKTGERVTDLSIRVRHTALDLLLTSVTFGIYSPMTITVQGKIARAGQ